MESVLIKKVFPLLIILSCFTTCFLYGQIYPKDFSFNLSGINFNNRYCLDMNSGVDTSKCPVVYPTYEYYNNYSKQDNLIIYPDYHMTPEWCKAGIYCKYKGNDVNVDSVKISIYLPIKDSLWGYREHNEINVRDPDWSGWWDEPYSNGFFIYTVKAKYGGIWYETGFYVSNKSNVFPYSFDRVSKDGLILYFKTK